MRRVARSTRRSARTWKRRLGRAGPRARQPEHRSGHARRAHAVRGAESEIAAQALTPPLRSWRAARGRTRSGRSRTSFAALRGRARRPGGTDAPARLRVDRTGILGLALEDGRLEEAYQALQLALELRPETPASRTWGAPAQRPEDLALESSFSARWRSGESAVRRGRLRAFLGLGQEGAFPAAHDGPSRGPRRRRLRGRRGAGPRARGALPGGARGREPPVMKDPGGRRFRPGLCLPGRGPEGARRLPPEPRRDALARGVAGRGLPRNRVGDRGSRGADPRGRAAETLDTPRQVLAASLCYSLLGHPERPSRSSATRPRGASRAPPYTRSWAPRRRSSGQPPGPVGLGTDAGPGTETSECLTFLASAELSQGNGTLSHAHLEPGRSASTPRTARRSSWDRSGASAVSSRWLGSSCPSVPVSRDGDRANRALARVCGAFGSIPRPAKPKRAPSRAVRPLQRGLSLFQTLNSRCRNLPPGVGIQVSTESECPSSPCA